LSGTNDRTYIDVAYTPSFGADLDTNTINNDEFALAGFGAGASGSVQKVDLMPLGGGVYRYLLTGSFQPGQVEVQFQQNSFGDNSARGPPSGFNLDFTQTFPAVGATADR